MNRVKVAAAAVMSSVLIAGASVLGSAQPASGEPTVTGEAAVVVERIPDKSTVVPAGSADALLLTVTNNSPEFPRVVLSRVDVVIPAAFKVPASPVDKVTTNAGQSWTATWDPSSSTLELSALLPIDGLLPGESVEVALKGIRAPLSVGAFTWPTTARQLGMGDSIDEFVVAPQPQLRTSPLRLVWLQMPADAKTDSPVTPPVAVAVRDQAGNDVTTYTEPVVLQSARRDELTGAMATPAGGVATFPLLVFGTAGTDVRLQATTAGFSSEPSPPFDVTEAGASPGAVVAPAPKAGTAAGNRTGTGTRAAAGTGTARSAPSTKVAAGRPNAAAGGTTGRAAPVVIGPKARPLTGGTLGAATGLGSTVEAEPEPKSAPAEDRVPFDERWADSVPTPSEVAHHLDHLGTNALLAALLLLLIMFPAELFNGTLRENYDEVRRWFAPLGRLARPLRGLWASSLRVPKLVSATFFTLAIGAGYTLLSPEAGLNMASLRLTLALTLGLGLTTVLSNAAAVAWIRLRYREPAFVALRWGALPFALGCVLVSRLLDFQPGYVYGLVAGFEAHRQLRKHERGQAMLAWSMMGLAAVAVSWLLSEPVKHWAEESHHAFWPLVFEETLVAMTAEGLTVLVLTLLPLTFLEGRKLYDWSRLIWLGVYSVVVVSFLQLIVHPGTESHGSKAPVTAYISFFIGFAALSFAFWGYFRFRRPRRSDELSVGAQPPVDAYTTEERALAEPVGAGR